MYQFWVYIIAILITIPSAVLGSFLLLRKSVMVSDAMSHSILPGLVVGFLIAKSLYSPLLLIFSSIFGVLTVFLIEWIYKENRVKKDASIGVSFTFLFALGIILIANFTSSNTDLHQECVLYGDLGAVHFNILTIDNLNLGPKALWTLLVLNILVITVISIGWKALTLSSFDSIYANTIGFKPHLWNYILMTLVSICIVIAFDIIGAILIISLLAAPAACSFLVAKHINSFVWFALIFGVINTLIGITISLQFNLVLSGTLALTHGVAFFAVFIVNKTFRFS